MAQASRRFLASGNLSLAADDDAVDPASRDSIALAAVARRRRTAALAAGPEPMRAAFALRRSVCSCCRHGLCFHLCNGIRHLGWDTGRGFAIPRAYLSGWIVVIASLLLTIAIWACVLARSGA